MIAFVRTKNLHTLPEYIPQDSIQQLSADGIEVIKANYKPIQYIIDLNNLITNRINNCRQLLPIWLKWEYIRELFIMPNGSKEAGAKKAADEYYAHRSQYPYQVYMNWPAGEQGNIFYNDKKFVTLLYEIHEDYFSDMSKVTDASLLTKEGMLFKLVVEHNMTNHLLGGDIDMTRDEYNKMRGSSVREVASTHGNISFRDVLLFHREE